MREINPKLKNLTDDELEKLEKEINEAIRPHQETLHDIELLKVFHKFQRGESLKDEFIGIHALKNAGLVLRTAEEQELSDAISKMNNNEPMAERERNLIDLNLTQIGKEIDELEDESNPSIFRRFFKGKR